jgi:hypothetical protein
VRVLQVKNWSQFQHYRDRNPVWVKLYLSLLDDYGITRLTDADRGQLFLIWLLAARNGGVLPNDPKWIAGRIACSGTLKLGKLIAAGFLIEADVEDSSSIPLAGVEQDACLEKRRDREETEERREETSPRTRGWTDFEADLPEQYRDAVDGAIRAANNPDALRRELVSLREAITGGPAYTPAQIGQALHELAVAGSRVTSAGLRAFCRRIAQGEHHAAPASTEGPAERVLRIAAAQDVAA